MTTVDDDDDEYEGDDVTLGFLYCTVALSGMVLWPQHRVVHCQIRRHVVLFLDRRLENERRYTEFAELFA